MAEKLKHILHAQQFDRAFLEKELFPLAGEMRMIRASKLRKSLEGKAVCLLFYEPSTRTRMSFEMATHFLGGTPFSTENAAEFSSAIKGETIEDTARIVSGYGYDALIMRHKEEGAAARAAAVSSIPIINAGDGKGQHPTQALLDVYTIYDHFGEVDNRRVVMVGDLAHGRTVNSLAYLLGKFDNASIDFVSPPGFEVQRGITEYLERHGVPFTENKSLREVVTSADVVYMTRPQKERFDIAKGWRKLFRLKQSSPFDSYKTDCRMDLEMLQYLPQGSIVMHPLPRNDELPPEADSDPRVIPFKQAENGLYIRMALLEMLLG